MAKATKLSSGNYRCKAYYTDEKGNYTSKSFTAETKKEAEYMAAQFLMEMKHKKKPENKTIGEMIDIFIDSRSNVLSPSTVVGYKKIRRTAFEDIMDTRAGFLTQQRYQEAVNEYAKGRKPKTVKEAHRLLIRVFQENHIDIDDKVINLPRMISTKIKPPTTEEVVIILEASKAKGIYFPVLLAALVGLRKSEIFALTYDDIDMSKGTISINKATVKDQYGEYVIKSTKTYAGTRVLHMPEQIKNALPPQEEGKDSLFDISPDAFDSRFKRLIAKLGLRYNFHSLRHYYASIMVLNNVPNKYAMQKMGHATDHMLKQVYQHVFEDESKQFDKDIEQFFKGKGI